MKQLSMLPKSGIKYSLYQEDIFNDIAHGEGHTVVIARAGSGKSFSIIEGIRHIPKKINGKPTKTLLVAFSKKIAENFEDKVPSYCLVKTCHALGNLAIRNAFGPIPLDPDKGLNVIIDILKEKHKIDGKEKFATALAINRALSLCKNCLIDTPSKIDDLLDRYDINVLELDRKQVISVICLALRRGKEIKTCIDFQDMIQWPYVFHLPIPTFQRVMIDEAQDISAAQLHLALSACSKDGRILACGDDRQVIFSWAGVDINSIDIIKKRLNAKVLELPISYRCATNIIKYAQEIVPDIQAAPNAKDGKITHINENNFLAEVKVGDFILSRVNAPNIYYCLALLKMGVKANIQGKDVGAGLAYIIKKSDKNNVNDFLDWLKDWKKSETERLHSKGKDATIIVDKSSCIEALCEDAKSIDDVLVNIKDIFTDGDDHDRVMLSSIHAAKGLERNRVFLLVDTFRYGDGVEEQNLKYVARTRAKEELFLVQNK
jgi:DNA helicase II / ATP-dependent DNA helicase PcrA